jgi:hypothetical protein
MTSSMLWKEVILAARRHSPFCVCLLFDDRMNLVMLAVSRCDATM